MEKHAFVYVKDHLINLNEILDLLAQAGFRLNVAVNFSKFLGFLVRYSGWLITRSRGLQNAIPTNFSVPQGSFGEARGKLCHAGRHINKAFTKKKGNLC